jgi:hypothetical protein
MAVRVGATVDKDLLVIDHPTVPAVCEAYSAWSDSIRWGALVSLFIQGGSQLGVYVYDHSSN